MDDLSVIGISKRNFINFLGNAGARSLGEFAPSFVADFFGSYSDTMWSAEL